MKKILKLFQIYEATETCTLFNVFKKYTTQTLMSLVNNRFVFSMVASFFVTVIIAFANYRNEMSPKRKRVYFVK